MKSYFKIPDKFYLVGAFIIIGTVMALIFNSLPDKESMAMAEKARILGVSDQNISLPLAIMVRDNENEWRGVSESTEINNILEELKVPLYPEDLVSAFPDPNLKIGTTININRAPTIYLIDGGVKKEFHTWSKTVSDLLSNYKITLSEIDKVSVPLSNELFNGARIEIKRMGITYSDEEIILPFENKEKEDNSLLKGRKVVSQEGKNGLRIKKYKLTYENNILVTKELINDEITQKPITKITSIGTYIPILSEQYGLSSWTSGKTASRRYRIGTKLRVINLANFKSVETIVGDYGPTAETGRVLDLNHSSFSQIANPGVGIISVKIEELAF